MMLVIIFEQMFLLFLSTEISKTLLVLDFDRMTCTAAPSALLAKGVVCHVLVLETK